ncbi:daptide biosynthesis intramembrane metalloprotease [Nocardioides lijunqiniae]|uniref:daptide biosynthesis intramembrane metalloprotease n=1 Tax=Nocardioides lijunqiniae TaxID=2760832 RepID=UPI001878BD1F|nr:daptide biosynthesis intramembrane metalloprotease [Nocardioides lijunqiniae]
MSRKQDEPVAGLPMRPKLATSVSVHPPRDAESRWVIERRGAKYYRVGSDVAKAARLLTGEHDRDDLLDLLGDPWDEAALEQLLGQFQSMRLLDDGRSATRTSTVPRRIVFVPPLTLQISLFNPSAMLTRLAPLTEVLSRRGPLALVTAVIVGGLLALAWHAADLRQALSYPVSGGTFLIFLLGVLTFTAIHEVAHGAVLTHYGAHPRRMGFMLFYLVPAFFCDVSDGWLLPRNQQRVRVALAGIVAQLACAGLCAVAALVVGAPEARNCLLLLAASMYLAGVVNLVPFVKLDGYLALMAHLDIPNLRAKAIADARNAVSVTLFGARRERELPGLRWAVPYGLACMVFPVYLVGFVAFAMWSRVLGGSGIVGALLVLTALSALAMMLVKGLRNLVAAARAGGASLVRIGAVGVLATGAVVLALGQVQVTQTVNGFYLEDADGVRLVMPTSVPTDRIESGQQVELRTNGMVRRPVTGSATVASDTASETELSALRFLPVELDVDLPTTYLVYELETQDAPATSEGTAKVESGERSLGGWLYAQYIEPAL